MKKLLFALLALPLLFVACDKENAQNEKNATMTITSENIMEFSAEGGEGVITYTLENAAVGALPVAACSAEWVSNIVVAEQITFDVAANDGEMRNATIVVKYGATTANIIIRQLSQSQAVLRAGFFGGEYYGSIYSPGLGNYYLHLSDNGFTNNGYDKPNSKYYCLDLYGPLYEGQSGGNVTLPIGTYSLNTDSDPIAWSIGYAYSGYRETNEDGASYDPYRYDNATLIVTEDGATLTATVEGVAHRVTFSGQPTIADMRY